MTHQWVRYVRENDIAKFVAVGWVPDPMLCGTVHGDWSIGMVWPEKLPAGVEPPAPDDEHEHVVEASASLGGE